MRSSHLGQYLRGRNTSYDSLTIAYADEASLASSQSTVEKIQCIRRSDDSRLMCIRSLKLASDSGADIWKGGLYNLYDTQLEN